MAAQEEFLKMIHDLEETAAANGNQLTREEIDGAFEGDRLTEENLDFIYKYFVSKKIKIIGAEEIDVRPEDEIPDRELSEDAPEESREAVSIYLEEMTGLSPVTREEEEELAALMLEGDEAARDRLIEAMLPGAAAIAREFEGRGMHFGDLIQEGNIGIILAAADYDPARDGRFSSHVGTQVRQRIREALAEYNDTSRSAEKLARGINRLNEISGTFAKENGREATLQELSSLMGMSEDEVRTLMKESLNAINYNPE